MERVVNHTVLLHPRNLFLSPNHPSTNLHCLDFLLFFCVFSSTLDSLPNIYEYRIYYSVFIANEVRGWILQVTIQELVIYIIGLDCRLVGTEINSSLHIRRDAGSQNQAKV